MITSQVYVAFWMELFELETLKVEHFLPHWEGSHRQSFFCV